MGKRWTKEHEAALRDGIGVIGWKALMRKTGRKTKHAIWSHAHQRFGSGITRGSYSVDQVVQETGYARSQLKRAAEALNQRWARTAPRGTFLITFDQVEDMVAWLAHDYWSKPLRLYRCVECGTIEAPHYRVGMCCRCYRRLCRRLAGLGVSASPAKIRQWVIGIGELDHRAQRVLLNLDKRRAPTMDDLDHLEALAASVSRL